MPLPRKRKIYNPPPPPNTNENLNADLRYRVRLIQASSEQTNRALRYRDYVPRLRALHAELSEIDLQVRLARIDLQKIADSMRISLDLPHDKTRRDEQNSRSESDPLHKKGNTP